MIPHVCGVITISLRNPPRRPDIQPLGGYGHYGRVAVKVAVIIIIVYIVTDGWIHNILTPRAPVGAKYGQNE